MTEKDIEQLLKELLEECDNEEFINTVDTYEEHPLVNDSVRVNEGIKEHGLVITTPDGSWFFVTVAKVL